MVLVVVVVGWPTPQVVLAVGLVALVVELMVLVVELMVSVVELVVSVVGMLVLMVGMDTVNTMTPFVISAVVVASAFDTALLLVGRLVRHNKRFLDLAMT